MIRIRDISLPPQQDMSQLVFAAARQLRIDHTQIKRLDIKKRSVDARKKNDVRLIYTVDVLVKGREDKILKMAHNQKASIAQDSFYEPPKPEHLPAQRPWLWASVRQACSARWFWRARAANRSF